MPIAFRRQSLRALATCATLIATTPLVAQSLPPAPVAPVRPVTETFFGKSVADPYRWMEDLSSPEVQAYAKAQNDRTRAVLDAIPGRAGLLKRIAELEASVPARIGTVARLPDDLWIYQKRGAADNQFKVYVRRGLAGGAERVLVDPEALTKARGEPIAVTFVSPSDSGRYLAYGLSAGGSEEASIHVLDVATGRDLIEPIDRAHYSDAAWMPDDSGFFYFRQRALPPGAPETEKYRFQSAFFHRMKGSGPDREFLKAGVPGPVAITPEEFPNVFPVTGTRWAFALPGNGVQNEVGLYAAPRADLGRRVVPWRKLFDKDADVTRFAVHGDDLYVLTHKDAPRYKLLKTSVVKPDLAAAEVVVPPGREVLVDVRAAKDGLYVLARDGTLGKLYRMAWTKGAKPEPVPLPREGSVVIDSTDPRLPGAVLTIGSWTRDFGIYASGTEPALVDTRLQDVGPFGAPTDLESSEVMVRSWDGVDVPLSIVHRKGLPRDGGNPTLLYGYGSYGITDDPVYVPRFLAWYEQGAVRATCHVRGGGAFGEEWHLAGKQATKPNTWKDFEACGEYLIREGYTSKARLAINGGSAGGILVGRAMTDRPDLFAAAVPQVGVLNTLRAEFSANGVPNIPEFGSVKDEAQFAALDEMDALRHVVDGVAYPATLVTTGINDPRVPPWESLKFTARLQAATSSDKPVLLRIDYAAGHGLGSTKTQRQEETADVWSFLLWRFGQAGFQPAR